MIMRFHNWAVENDLGAWVAGLSLFAACVAIPASLIVWGLYFA